jgi:hypothetical protein
MSNRYAVGALVKVAAVFRNPATNGLLDPTGVQFKFKHPVLGIVTTYVYGTDAQLVRDSQGMYHVTISADAAGHWYWKFTSTGTGQAAQKGYFTVESDDF